MPKLNAKRLLQSLRQTDMSTKTPKHFGYRANLRGYGEITVHANSVETLRFVHSKLVLGKPFREALLNDKAK